MGVIMCIVFKLVVFSIAYILAILAPDELKGMFFSFFIFKERPEVQVEILKIFNSSYEKIEYESGKPFFCCGETSYEPGVPPTPSYQGSKDSCTLHSVGKCIVSWLDRNGFDADQDEIIQHLEKDLGINRMWPSACNQIEVKIQAQKKEDCNEEIELTLKLCVKKIKFDEFKATKIPNAREYILCTSQLSHNDNHPVYIELKDANSLTLNCINSWGPNKSNPKLKVNRCNQFYAIEITNKNDAATIKNETPKDNQTEKRCQWDLDQSKDSIVKDVPGKQDCVKSQISKVLSEITVSKVKYDSYERELKEQTVSNWEESSEATFFLGVRNDSFMKFLRNFQKSNDMDEKTLKAFENMEFLDDSMSTNVLTFTCNATESNETKTTGKYGMYVEVKQEHKIDVAYTMFTFTANFAGSSLMEATCKDTAENPGLLTSSTCKVPTGETTDLGQNWILKKALENFVRHGTIKTIKYV